jgi:hypothetical protein
MNQESGKAAIVTASDSGIGRAGHGASAALPATMLTDVDVC